MLFLLIFATGGYKCSRWLLSCFTIYFKCLGPFIRKPYDNSSSHLWYVTSIKNKDQKFQGDQFSIDAPSSTLWNWECLIHIRGPVGVDPDQMKVKVRERQNNEHSLRAHCAGRAYVFRGSMDLDSQISNSTVALVVMKTGTKQIDHLYRRHKMRWLDFSSYLSQYDKMAHRLVNIR